jgi:crotonobetainyl-CoA:carnitine CoA-transferase CaiB-like acyl-CoA transferase
VSALSAFKVLELSEGVSGEYCGKLLSDFGAQVIKIENPLCGSPTRRLGPFGPGTAKGENSGLFAYLNTNKHSVALDLSSVSGVQALGKLLKCVDVVIDDHPDGWLKNIGLDPSAFHIDHPQLVLCAITAHGQSPPQDRVHAEDLNVFHSSGWGYHTPSAADETLPPLKGAGQDVAIHVYPGAHHAFDAASLKTPVSVLGHHLEFNQQAADQSAIAVREFLDATTGNKEKQP